MRRFVFVLALVGCTDLFGPEVEYWEHRPMDPVPAEYATWYAEVEQCLGQVGNFDAVRWFVADSIRREGRPAGAVLEFPATITMTSDYTELRWAVKHEMIHHVTQQGDEIHGVYAECQVH